MFRASLLSSSLRTSIGSDATAHRSRLADSLSLSGVAAPRTHISHLAEPLSLPYRHIDDPLSTSQDGRWYRYALDLAEEAIESAMLDPVALKRTGIFLGSSSFNVGEAESRLTAGTAGDPAVVLDTVGQGKLSRHLKQHFKLGGPDFAYSTACTSSANAMLAAHQMLSQQVIDHALVLGLEFFNETTLLGFHNLGLLANDALLPFDDRRDGLVLGEAGAALVLSREPKQGCLQLCGGASGTDTQSLTSANVDGSTIASTLEDAINNARISKKDIAAIKVHGTGSPMSDEAEARGVLRVFDELPPLVALKPAIGHTLGARGAAEFALWHESLADGFLPANTGIAKGEQQLGVNLNQRPDTARGDFHLHNCFSFGGNNTVLVSCWN